MMVGAGLTLGGGGTDGRGGRPDTSGWLAAVGPWAERPPGPEMGPVWPGPEKGHGSLIVPRPCGRLRMGRWPLGRRSGPRRKGGRSQRTSQTRCNAIVNPQTHNKRAQGFRGARQKTVSCRISVATKFLCEILSSSLQKFSLSLRNFCAVSSSISRALLSSCFDLFTPVPSCCH